ncbi:MAG TPA: hypothetical protein VJS64_02930 [Pyrinomonadaceae bacterium]|nr:hypothetical protein [Pyrinomonadaceae bacterium]
MYEYECHDGNNSRYGQGHDVVSEVGHHGSLEVNEASGRHFIMQALLGGIGRPND